MLLTPFVQAANQASTILRNNATISYSPDFVSRGSTFSIKVFFPGYVDYKPRAFDILQDLGINTIRVYGAGFEEFSVDKPDWAEKLKAFLDLAGNNGIKVVFHQLGPWNDTDNDAWAFGIRPQDGIEAAKAKIDALAGKNTLGYNFLTDSRTPFWILLNEPFLDYVANGGTGVKIEDWVRAIGTYIHSKGGKATIGYGSIHHGDAAPSNWIPLIRDWADYVIFHWYAGGDAVQAQNNGQSVFDAVYNSYSNAIDGYLKEMTGYFGAARLMIGECGIERYDRSGATEETRGEFYRAMFQAVKDKGLGATFPFILFDIYNLSETWGAIATDGTYFTNVTNQYKMYYLK